MVHIKKCINRPSSHLIDGFTSLSSATIYEASGRSGYIDSSIKPVCSGMLLCGCAVTVQCAPGDNLMLHKAIDIAGSGDIIVANVAGAYEFGYWGDLMTVSAISKGIKGLVIDGGVRDLADIKESGFKVFSRGICIKGTKKEKPGLLNHPMFFGGSLINPGDIIFGDDDGLVVISLGAAEDVLERSRKRVSDEENKREILKSGISSLEYNKLVQVLEKLGVVEEKYNENKQG